MANFRVRKLEQRRLYRISITGAMPRPVPRRQGQMYQPTNAVIDLSLVENFEDESESKWEIERVVLSGPLIKSGYPTKSNRSEILTGDDELIAEIAHAAMGHPVS